MLVPATTTSLALTANQAGQIFFIPALTSGNLTITLPAVALGLSFTVMWQTTQASGHTTKIQVPASETLYGGYDSYYNDGPLNINAKTSITTSADQQPGDILIFISDGTKWFVQGTAWSQDISNNSFNVA